MFLMSIENKHIIWNVLPKQTSKKKLRFLFGFAVNCLITPVIERKKTVR